MEGDLETTHFDLQSNPDFALMQEYKSKGMPVIAVFLSGRPRGLDAAIDLADAFIAAWLPGSEGAGLADVFLDNEHDFKGRLPFAWPNAESASRFERGFGLSVKQN